MIIVAFDPGKRTSWAKFDTRTPQHIDVGDVDRAGIGRLTRPCAVHIKDLIRDADLVIVEDVSPHPKEGVVSVATFALAFGGILAAVQGSEKPLRTVTPKQWSVVLRLKATDSKEEKKRAALAYVKELWPETRSQLTLAEHHNRADAALMIKWFVERGPGKDVAESSGDSA